MTVADFRPLRRLTRIMIDRVLCKLYEDMSQYNNNTRINVAVSPSLQSPSSQFAHPAWIAVDWGTSNVRAWAMDGGDNILDQVSSPRGMNAIAADAVLGFEGVLIDLIERWLPAKASDRMRVVVCGMAGAKQGWLEAPYCSVPVRPDELASGAVRPAVSDQRIDVAILPGLKQVDDPDVMRGEETQLVGFMAAHPGFDGWVCLPGTHSKWARVSGGAIRAFRTYMTGEVFALLSGQSILRHSMDDRWDDAVFEQTVREAASAPTGFLHKLFTVRASGLVGNADAASQPGASVLSGAVIGSEIADVVGDLGDKIQIALIGDGKLAGLYRKALAAHGRDAEAVDGAAITIAGLARAYRAINIA
ncbi:2-dehydro-3-deoxygalactonokinase [Thalassospira australica]|uniref:2-dehydro-3-deoxygalactonokinase n=1 Tax=Thalassospira australica TaxID=1528106 RepID=UPI00384E4E0C